jgi:hypothetical protein
VSPPPYPGSSARTRFPDEDAPKPLPHLPAPARRYRPYECAMSDALHTLTFFAACSSRRSRLAHDRHRRRISVGVEQSVHTAPVDRGSVPIPAGCSLQESDFENSHGCQVLWDLRACNGTEAIRERWIGASWIIELVFSGKREARPFRYVRQDCSACAPIGATRRCEPAQRASSALYDSSGQSRTSGNGSSSVTQ